MTPATIRSALSHLPEAIPPGHGNAPTPGLTIYPVPGSEISVSWSYGTTQEQRAKMFEAEMALRTAGFLVRWEGEFSLLAKGVR